MAKFCALYSGSSGNSACVSWGGRHLLVDAGVSCKKIVEALAAAELDTAGLAGVLITHEHDDHVKGLAVLLKKFTLPVYASKGTLEYLAGNGLVPEGAILREIAEPTDIAGINVTPFATPHDGVQSLGFALEGQDGRRIGIATDLGCMTPQIVAALQGCDLIMLESNYDTAMLDCGPYPYFLKQRIKGATGHLSNDACSAALSGFLQAGTTRFVLGHLSMHNNMPQLAHQSALCALTMGGYTQNKDFVLQVARRSACSDKIML